MDLEDGCLVSQEIRELVERRVIKDSSFDESRIQPSSFEPSIGEEVFVIDTDRTLFRPSGDSTVYRSLLELPKRRRQKVNISNGFEMKVGFSYLLPLEQRIRFDGFRMMKSSQKSSDGRLFPNTRLLTDYNFSFDEVFDRGYDKERMMWLLIQPLAFNLGVSPGLCFNQLRFMKGFNAQLTPKEIVGLWESNPILYSEEKIPICNPDIGEALQIHIDLEGKSTKGIVALRARKNPNPIDLENKKFYVDEDYFEPIKANKGILNVRRGEHYLFFSSEILNIPECNNAELKAHSHQGISGPLHRAGFVDNGFVGDLVFEVTSEEKTDLEIHNGMTFGELAVFRTICPDKVYGNDIGSNYKFQRGPRTAKYFKGFDFGMAARNHAKLNRDVLVCDSDILKSFRKKREGFEFISDVDSLKLIELVEKEGFFHSRYDCEGDELVLQVIPYVLGFGSDGTIFSYVRAKNIEDYGDPRLFGKHSLGLGGHIARRDGPDFIKNGLEREVFREEVRVSGDVTRPRFFGTLYQPDKPVDKVHFGLVYGIYADSEIVPKERSIVSGRMVKVEDVLNGSYEPYETWSKVLIPHLSDLYNIVSKNL